MSRNFELMQEAWTSAGTPTIPKARPQTWLFDRKKKPFDRGRAFSGDKTAQEESRLLVQNIFLSGGEGSPRVVVFAGVDSPTSCTGICANAAETLAGHKLGTVCLVGGNFGSPNSGEIFGISNHDGLTDSLMKSGPIRDFAKVVRPDNLWLLSWGSRAVESTGLLNSEMMKRRVSEMRIEFDYVLIDLPPLHASSDGVALASWTDGLVLVLEANSTRRDEAARVTANLRAANVKILGAVLNKSTLPIPEST
jgi:Mrp family chromosome partitioning ATPase